MTPPVKTRRYRSPQRQAQAAATRQRILQAARRLFSERGYQATAITSIAQEAGVSVDTLYAAVGRKPQILRAVIDELLGGEQASQRDYVRAVRAKPTAAHPVVPDQTDRISIVNERVLARDFLINRHENFLLA